jgi:UDP-3-O-[3-hydroxymyristoyl] N-acetylglucosamine deacetylase
MSVADLSQAAPQKAQRTLEKSFSLSGVGLFTGEIATLKLCPAEANTGIVFKRMDLPFQPLIPAKLKTLKSVARCTMLSHREASIQTVEHLLAALHAFAINNAVIEISGPEVPILDGSAKLFVEGIEKAKVVEQKEMKCIYRLASSLFWSKEDVHLIALPSEEYRISYTLHYPHSFHIGSQYFSIKVGEETFKKEIAPSRTFSLYEEIAPMIEKGMIKGGSLESGVVVGEKGIMNPEGLRFSDEFVRHKILDLIGDLSLMNLDFVAHIIAIRSGHASNHAFGLELLDHLKRENS